MKILNNNGYFAAANSRGGFVSFFEDVFRSGELDYLYIIKGGSGTGKSRLMREIATAAEKSGDEAEFFYCSSDPMSLDGIILKKRRVGVIDGTPPHTEEPSLPGCYDEIINLGEFWDGRILRENRERIAELTAKKKQLYKGAYSYLSAAGKATEAAELLTLPAIKAEKVCSWAERLAGRFQKSRSYCEKIRLTSAISYMGVCDTGIFYNRASRRFVLNDPARITPVVLSALRRTLSDAGSSVLLSFSPLDTGNLNGIYIKDEGVSFTAVESSESDAVINTDRFLDRDIYRENRARIRYLRKSAEAMVNSAVETMKHIYGIHSDVEKIYASAMDFKAKERYTAELIKTILG